MVCYLYHEGLVAVARRLRGDKTIHGRYYIGQQAAEQYVKNQMRGRFMQSLKPLLPDESFDGTMIAGVGYKQLEDLIATIMTELKSRADKYVGVDVKSNVGFEETLWSAADKMRNNMDPAEYKHVVFGFT